MCIDYFLEYSEMGKNTHLAEGAIKLTIST